LQDVTAAPAATGASTRAGAIARALAHFDSGAFERTLARRVAIPTVSQGSDRVPEQAAALRHYLDAELTPSLAELGFECRVHPNPEVGGGPLLIARRIEDAALPTLLSYGHADVIRGQDASWRRGAGPWALAREGDRLYGRGTADNKGQHSVNLAALEAVLAECGGRLGFNSVWLFETSEETGSPGLHAFAREHAADLAADLFLASDGPRLHADAPTLFLGSRGTVNFTLECRAREGGHHSGNWGGVLKNPGLRLAHAIASLADARGAITVPALRPPPIPASVRAALAGVRVGGDAGDPATDAGWGEPGLSEAERLFAWNTLEPLAFVCGNPEHPVNAVPPRARATMHMRFVVGSSVNAASGEPATALAGHLRAHLDAAGFDDIAVEVGPAMAATRLDPEHPWVRFCAESIGRTLGRAPTLLPNLGGSLPNDVFAEVLGLPTVWVPHSHPGCNQHAPDEHLMLGAVREGLAAMAGLWWDLGERSQVDAASLRHHAAPRG
jgi:acetylornithine deacetylase/succinyl-diaminopimelate desuccinylase-like protein